MSHTSEEELQQTLVNARKQVEVGAIYTHYKSPDKKYIVEFVGFLEESEKVCVGYRALYGEGILWVRSLSNFTEEVEDEVKRFIKL